MRLRAPGDATGGAILLGAAILALVWANVGSSAYESLWTTHVGGAVGPIDLDLSLRDWTSELLMALFFFLIAIEVKRELVSPDGALAKRSVALVPIAAALGGMIVPAALYLAINLAAGEAGSLEGWAIPIATDVAFALAVLSAIGRMAPSGLRAFLLTVAIADDVGTIIVIALFFTADLALLWLAAAAFVALLIWTVRRLGLTRIAAYVALAAVLWVATHESGVHATIAGVVVGLLTPLDRIAGLDRALAPASAYVVLPLFALANAGIPVDSEVLSGVFTAPIGLGIIAGLVLGKPLGLLAASALSVKRLGGTTPAGVGLTDLGKLGFVAGVGFTVAIFIAGLALDGEALAEAKAAILIGSAVSAILALAIFAAGRVGSRA